MYACAILILIVIIIVIIAICCAGSGISNRPPPAAGGNPSAVGCKPAPSVAKPPNKNFTPLTSKSNKVTMYVPRNNTNMYLTAQFGSIGLTPSSNPVTWTRVYNKETGGYFLQSGNNYIACCQDFGCTATELSFTTDPNAACNFSFEPSNNGGYLVGTANGQYLSNKGDYVYYTTKRCDATNMQVFGM